MIKVCGVGFSTGVNKGELSMLLKKSISHFKDIMSKFWYNFIDKKIKKLPTAHLKLCTSVGVMTTI